MDKSKRIYDSEFPVGAKVRVASRNELERFAKEWKYHHPLEPTQLHSAGIEAEVTNVYFYHGGDELYQLAAVPGIWHLQCLEPIS